MKKLLILLMTIGITIQLTACGDKKVIYKQGVYEGVGEGHIDKIKVEVTTDEYEIKEIKIIEEEEIPLLSKIVYEDIPKKVIKANSTKVDTVTGATYTSKGLIDAIEDALNKAMIEVED
ncbi:FMN-binding protein [Oceanirhabdus sp. W0125-5]|uniref:FMN-binding protein n=1 Tax=Oceanirhabdus sp. W0125-5 TaxID=2999116 RepID=UPI0022F2B6BD|nr:FMN-binding protein [Oceanirhabdus sp. W0125-5]WBW97105.1 FMN-binding protein [Oceanirhabdus sp. W0125-5]